VRRLVGCDECIPRGLAVLLSEDAEVLTVRKLGLAGRTDDMVRRALQALLSVVLVTVNRGFRWTAPARIGRVAVVLLYARSNQLVDLVEALPALRKAIRRAEPGRVMEVRAAR